MLHLCTFAPLHLFNNPSKTKWWQKKARKQKVVKKTNNNDLKKEFMAQCVKHIAMKIIEAREAGRILHGVAKKLLLEGQVCFPEMNINMISYAVKKLIDEKAENSLNLSTVITSAGLSSISSLTDNVEGGTRSAAKSQSNSNSSDASAALLMLSLTADNSTNVASQNSATRSKTGATTAAEVSIQEFLSSIQQTDDEEHSTCVGRPKGTSAADFMLLEERIELATKEAMEWLTT
jgi:hypothetical protein